MRILTRDFNAKIGADNTVYNKVTGLLKQNGKRFAHRCFFNQLVIGGSIFSHKRIYKATRRFPEQVTEIRSTISHQQEISKSIERCSESGYFIKSPSTNDDSKAIPQEV